MPPTSQAAPLPGAGAMASRAESMSRAEVEMAAAAHAENVENLKRARERAKSIRLRLEKLPDPNTEVVRLNQVLIGVKEEKDAFVNGPKEVRPNGSIVRTGPGIDKRISLAKADVDAAQDRAAPAINERAALARELEQAEAAVKRLEGKRG